MFQGTLLIKITLALFLLHLPNVGFSEVIFNAENDPSCRKSGNARRVCLLPQFKRTLSALPNAQQFPDQSFSISINWRCRKSAGNINVLVNDHVFPVKASGGNHDAWQNFKILLEKDALNQAVHFEIRLENSNQHFRRLLAFCRLEMNHAAVVYNVDKIKANRKGLIKMYTDQAKRVALLSQVNQYRSLLNTLYQVAEDLTGKNQGEHHARMLFESKETLLDLTQAFLTDSAFRQRLNIEAQEQLKLFQLQAYLSNLKTPGEIEAEKLQTLVDHDVWRRIKNAINPKHLSKANTEEKEAISKRNQLACRMHKMDTAASQHDALKKLFLDNRWQQILEEAPCGS